MSNTNRADKILSMADLPASMQPSANVKPVKPEPVRVGGTFSAIDDERAARDEAASRVSGFALRPPVYDRGTTVIEWGVQNARAKREEWAAMPTADVECARLAAVITNEGRKGVCFKTADIRMTGVGRIGPVKPDGSGVLGSFPIEPDALASVFTRVSIAAGVRSPGAAMADLTWGDEDMTRVRAQAMNAIAAKAAKAEGLEAEAASIKNEKFTPSITMLRTRLGRPDSDGHRPRQIFAAVSDSYTALDIDQVAKACGNLTKEADLRCETHYNGRSARITLIGNSDVKPEHYVAGEIFRAGIEVSTDDTGKGGIKVKSLAWRNLCLNLIIIDRGEIKVASIRHIGNVNKLTAALAAALKEAQGKIQHFIESWGLACKKSLISDVRQIGGLDTALDELSERMRVKNPSDGLVRELLAGTFRGLADEDKIPLSLRTIDAVMGDLYEAHDDRRNDSGARVNGPTRASVANALTLYAHAYQDNPEIEAALEEAAGKIVTARGRLPFLPVSD